MGLLRAVTTSGQEPKLAKLFEANGYDVSQAVGRDDASHPSPNEPAGSRAGEVGWFATARAGLARPRTYLVAWPRCPEDLGGALAELERDRVARGADRALGVVMRGALPVGYRIDLTRVTEAITYARLALEISDLGVQAREHVRRYEEKGAPARELRRHGKSSRGETEDVAELLLDWALGASGGSLALVGATFDRTSLLERLGYELDVRGLSAPESPAARFLRPSAPTDDPAALAVCDHYIVDVEGRRHGTIAQVAREQFRALAGESPVLVMGHLSDEEPIVAADDAVVVLDPGAVDVLDWYRTHLDDDARYERFLAARERSPELAHLSGCPENMSSLLTAMRSVPIEGVTVDAWIARVAASHVSDTLMAVSQLPARAPIEDAALEQFAFGRPPRRLPTIVRELPVPWQEKLRISTWLTEPGAPFPTRGLHGLVRDALLANKIADEIEHGNLDIVVRHNFPRQHVLLCLAALSPSAEEKVAAIRARIDREVEHRLELTLAHLLKRSTGAIRMSLAALREDMPPELEARHRYELARVDEELSFQSALAEQTNLWKSVPNGPAKDVALREMVAEVLAPLARANLGTRCDVELSPDLRVLTRPMALREILHIILENAFHAAALGRSESAWVRVTGHTDGDAVVVEICDSGPGVPPSSRERIFEPYVTTKKGGTEPLGTGLGLTMARDYAKHIGAEIGLDAGRAETCFFVRIAAWKDAP